MALACASPFNLFSRVEPFWLAKPNTGPNRQQKTQKRTCLLRGWQFCATLSLCFLPGSRYAGRFPVWDTLRGNLFHMVSVSIGYFSKNHTLNTCNFTFKFEFEGRSWMPSSHRLFLKAANINNYCNICLELECPVHFADFWFKVLRDST